MNNFLPKEDRELINFVRQHRPIPPEANSHLESQLMQLIEEQPQQSSRSNSSLFWFVPGAIAMGIVFTWNNQRFLQYTPQLAQDKINVESFLIDSWEETMENSYLSETPETEIYQLLSTVKSPQVISSTTFE